MQRRYVILDVFTDRAFAGNPLAVVLDGAGLDDGQMQTVAGEFNLSETVFVTSIEEDGLKADIRIFTPTQELPFAGHPTIGTARRGNIWKLLQMQQPLTPLRSMNRLVP